jgi:hypothetical protein
MRARAISTGGPFRGCDGIDTTLIAAMRFP